MQKSHASNTSSLFEFPSSFLRVSSELKSSWWGVIILHIYADRRKIEIIHIFSFEYQNLLCWEIKNQLSLLMQRQLVLYFMFYSLAISKSKRPKCLTLCENLQTSLSRNAALNNVFLCLFNPVKDKIIIRWSCNWFYILSKILKLTIIYFFIRKHIKFGPIYNFPIL